ncbi:MAG: hypothetical protein OEU76_03160, partial [Cyclobacteriaceae bacterium]|nr:hypothetical protein [Cyclobacteriaceae bacterium]
MKLLNKTTLLLMSFMALAIYGFSQSDLTPLFQKEDPIDMRLAFSIKEVKKETNDTIYTPAVLHYKNESGTWDSIAVEIRARGNFRRANCSFPPIRVKMKKKDTEGTIFEGNKSLKLVLPCTTASSGNDLIIREYLCYLFIEP